jgi:hypothetical protein
LVTIEAVARAGPALLAVFGMVALGAAAIALLPRHRTRRRKRGFTEA